MRKDICVQHWVSRCEARYAFERLRRSVIRVPNFV
jgi:hypothetical protein